LIETFAIHQPAECLSQFVFGDLGELRTRPVRHANE
jgi:hypothetical protein